MEINQKILEIMELALAIAPPEQPFTGETHPAVFVEWLPHCSQLCVRIFYEGWRSGSYPDVNLKVYTDEPNACRGLDEIIDTLARIIGEEGAE